MSYSPTDRGIQLAFWPFAMVMMLATALNTNLDWDENMYVTAGVLDTHLRLYRDFAYLQTPYLPWIYGLVFDALRPDSPLLVARLLGAGFSMLALSMVFSISKKTSSPHLAIATALLFLCNETVQWRMGLATNDMPALALSLVAVRLVTPPGRLPLWQVALSGLAMAMAAGLKLYFVALTPVLAFSVAVQNHERRFGSLLMFTLGFVSGIAPLALLWMSEMSLVKFNVLGYHMLNTRWRAAAHYPGLSLPGRIWMAIKTLGWPTNITLIMGLVLALPPLRAMAKLRSSLHTGVLLASLAVSSLALALMPSPFWPHYLTPLSTFLLLLLPLALHPGTGGAPPAHAQQPRILVALLGVFAIFGGVHLCKSLLDLRHESFVQQFHSDAAKLRQWLPHGATVATLFPLYPLEAGLNIQRELSTGAFTYRVGDLLPLEELRRMNLVSPATIPAMLNATTPGAILLGFETDPPSLESPMREWAITHLYTKHVLTLGSRLAELYVKP